MGRVTLSFEGVTLAFVTRGVTLDLERVTLSFFARVSPLVQAHGGGAGAPDLGGLVFARVCGRPGLSTVDQRRERQSRRRRRRSYPIFEGVTLDLPYFFRYVRERVTLSFFHVRGKELPYLFSTRTGELA